MPVPDNPNRGGVMLDRYAGSERGGPRFARATDAQDLTAAKGEVTREPRGFNPVPTPMEHILEPGAGKTQQERAAAIESEGADTQGFRS